MAALQLPSGHVIAMANLPDIVDVVSKYMTLKRLGSSYAGQCPFHPTNTYDAFRVSPRRNIFKCFNCNESGGPVEFVMKMENVDYKHALEILDLKEYRPMKKQNPKNLKSDKNQPILKSASDFWLYNLYAHREGLRYFNSRGINNHVLIQNQHIGYAPKRGLLQHLLNSGYCKEEILKEGLAKEGKYGLYDFFRERIVFPVFNANGNIATITSRSIDPHEKIKHLHLSGNMETLYNENGIDGTYVILCEGIMDCLSLMQEGFNAVATYGTGGLKPSMAQKLKKNSTIYLAFDKERNQAGQKGRKRAMEIFRCLRMDNVYPLELPFMDREKIDINDLFSKHGFTREDFSSLMEDALERKDCYDN
jgi:DNA primase